MKMMFALVLTFVSLNALADKEVATKPQRKPSSVVPITGKLAQQIHKMLLQANDDHQSCGAGSCYLGGVIKCRTQSEDRDIVECEVTPN